jgi:hypothetical protein
MEPAQWFPWMALVFAIAGLWRWQRSGRMNGAASTWLLMAAIFAAVAAWLRWHA